MKFTFGKTQASQTLETLVGESPCIRRKISSLLSDYSKKLLNITEIKDPETVRLLMALLRDNTLKRVDVKKNLNEEVKTFTKNVVVYRYRVFSTSYEKVLKFVNAKAKNKMP